MADARRAMVPVARSVRRGPADRRWRPAACGGSAGLSTAASAAAAVAAAAPGGMISSGMSSEPPARVLILLGLPLAPLPFPFPAGGSPLPPRCLNCCCCGAAAVWLLLWNQFPHLYIPIFLFFVIFGFAIFSAFYLDWRSQKQERKVARLLQNDGLN